MWFQVAKLTGCLASKEDTKRSPTTHEQKHKCLDRSNSFVSTTTSSVNGTSHIIASPAKHDFRLFLDQMVRIVDTVGGQFGNQKLIEHAWHDDGWSLW